MVAWSQELCMVCSLLIIIWHLNSIRDGVPRKWSTLSQSYGCKRLSNGICYSTQDLCVVNPSNPFPIYRWVDMRLREEHTAFVMVMVSTVTSG